MRTQEPDSFGRFGRLFLDREDLKRILLAQLVIGAFAFAEMGAFWLSMEDPIHMAGSSSLGPIEEQGLQGGPVPSAVRLPCHAEKGERHDLEARWGVLARAILLEPDSAASGGAVDKPDRPETPGIRPVASGLPVGDAQCR